MKVHYALYEDQELTLNALKTGIFPIKATKGGELKILTHTTQKMKFSIKNIYSQ